MDDTSGVDSDPIHIQSCRAPWSLRPALGFRLAYSNSQSCTECEVLVIATRTKVLPSIDKHLIQLVFPICIEFRSIHEGCYICHGSRLAHMADEDPDAYLDWFMKAWEQSDVCPDPNFYHVTNSTWKLKKQFHDPQRWNHYLLMIDDGYVEFLADRCVWREFQREEIPKNGFVDGLVEIASGEIRGME